MGLFQSKLANNDSLQKENNKDNTDTRLQKISDAVDMINSNEEPKSPETSQPTYTEEFKYVDEITPRAIHSNTCSYTVVEEFKCSEETDSDDIQVKTEETFTTERTFSREETYPTEETFTTERTFSNEEMCPVEETVATEETCPVEETVATERTFSNEETYPVEEKCSAEESKKKKRSKRNRMK